MFSHSVLFFIFLIVFCFSGDVYVKDITIFGILRIRDLSLMCKSILLLLWDGTSLKLKNSTMRLKKLKKK